MEASVEIFETPWRNKLLNHVRKTSKELIICAPYFSKDVISQILGCCKPHVKVKFLFGFTRDSMKGGQSDPDAVIEIISSDRVVEAKQIENLHAKIYIFDGKKAIVTSSNPTTQGLERNIEFGVFLAGEHARKLYHLMMLYWNDPKATTLDSKWLQKHRSSLEGIIERLKSRSKKTEEATIGKRISPKGVDEQEWALLWSTGEGDHIQEHIRHMEENGSTLWGTDFKIIARHFNFPLKAYLYVKNDKVRFKAVIASIEIYETRHKPQQVALRPERYRNEYHKTYLELTQLIPISPIAVTSFKKHNGENVSKFGVEGYVRVFDPMISTEI